jgi:hypothetical protein
MINAFARRQNGVPVPNAMKKEEGKLVRVDRVAMRWGEMDALGHMNNVSYFRYFEQARISWFDTLAIDYRPGSEGPILGSLSCRYIKPQSTLRILRSRRMWANRAAAVS